MTWMLTSTGACLDLRFIAEDAIGIDDIAHHLSQINRFTGACLRPYSVAEHSLLVVQILQQAGETSPYVLMAALLHDAHEAYTTDVSTPMKQVVGQAWHDIEAQVQHAVQRRFCVVTASAVWRNRIRDADLTALSTERAQLMPDTGPDWPCTHTHPPADWVRLADREAMTWRDWRQAYLDAFAELEFGRQGA